MAAVIPFPVEKQAIEAAIFEWMNLLAEERYEEAYAFMVHDPYYEWTPALIASVINGYGAPYEEKDGPRHKVTKMAAVAGDAPGWYREVDFYDEPRQHISGTGLVVGEGCYSLPVDGEWGDLSVTFSLIETDTGVVLELGEIHVF